MTRRFVVATLTMLFAASASAQQFKMQKWNIGGDGGTDYVAVDATGRVFVSRQTHVMVVDGMTGKVAVQLATERLRLRPPVPEDASAAAELLGDPEVMRFLGGEVVPREHVDEVVTAWVRRWQENGFAATGDD